MAPARNARNLRQTHSKMRAWHQHNEVSRRLAANRGDGPNGAALLLTKTQAPEHLLVVPTANPVAVFQWPGGFFNS